MKRKTAALTVILVFLFPVVVGAIFIESVKANGVPLTYLPEITINSNGTITPSTSLIKRTGSTYNLTGNVDGYVIHILNSNIVFDGAGYTINASAGDNPGIHLSNVTGVTVKNVEVIGRYTSIYLYYSSYCLITDIKTNYSMYLTGSSNYNTIANSTIRRLAIYANNNLFIENNVHDLWVSDSNNNSVIKNNVKALWVGGSNNKFYQNNFVLEDFPTITRDNSWDNGSIGNYWGNYSTKYPNALEIGNTGRGDTPYIIERDENSTKEYPNAKNVDNYPLMYPYDIENDAITLPTRETEPFPTALVATASAASAGIIAVGLLVYFKRRKH
jgi:hypothetical protein